MSQPSSRQDKVQQLRKQQRSGERRRGALIWGGAVVAALAVAGAGAFVVVNHQNSKPSLSAVKSYQLQAGQHVERPVKYPQTPPVGGEHNPVWLNCGVYNQPVPNENAVHALEHGAVWVTYREGTSPADVAKLRAALPDTYSVLSPIKTQPAPVMATAWGKQLQLTGADDKRLPAFIKAYRLGPQTPEPGAACTGGIDAPGKQA